MGSAAPELNAIHHGDCLEILPRYTEPIADLAFADPPFNIGYDYDTYKDKVDEGEYVDWTEKWMQACVDVLKPHGSFYIASGDEYAAQVRLLGRSLGLELRNWIIWSYTFGQCNKAKFARSHAHIFYFVKDANHFVFNDRHVRVPSARHTEYQDARADPWGKVPDDTWADFPRVCGTFREREGWHGCQMPESLLMRIIRASSNPGDVVLDPFSGSGTTVVAAAKLGRQYIATDVSENYVAHGRKRLAEIKTALGPDADHAGWSRLQVDTLASLFRETGTARGNLTAIPVALGCFTRLLNERLGSDFAPDDVAQQLELLDRNNELPRLRNDRLIKPKRRSLGRSPKRPRQDADRNGEADEPLFSAPDNARRAVG